MAGRFTIALPEQSADLASAETREGARLSRFFLIGRVLAPSALVLAAFIFRQRIVDLIQHFSGLEFVFTVVHLYSTMSVRLILGVLTFALFVAVGITAFKYARHRVRTVIFTGFCTAFVAFALWFLGRGPNASIAGGVLAGTLVAANAIARETWHSLLADRPFGRLVNLGFWVLIGIEVVLPRGYFAWIDRSKSTAKPSPIWLRILPGALLAAGAFALMAPFPKLMQLGQTMFMSPAATIVFGPEYQVFSKYDVSDLARNPVTGDVFLCGDSQESPKVLRRGEAPAVDISISNNGNEFCEMADTRAFVTVANSATDDLLVIDPDSLKVRSSLRLDKMPYGEIFLASQPKFNLMAVASEDEGGMGGGPTVRIVELGKMKVVQQINAEVGYLIADPNRPVLFTNHFAMDAGVRAWDMRTGKLLATSARFGRSDRMAFDAARNEVLATVPETGQIWRLDAATLTSKPPIKTVFGARGLGIDADRDLLLVASFVTDELDVVDLKTGHSLRRYRLGPWLRDVLVVSDEGVAYVASRYGVYRVNYLR
ncbi:hypothetical protein GCM10023264_09630 [Sphingomonas daechungensis]|uniref:WD40 repeat domain-containing protein n=1 Tax=Sphingomonas daechungensis TaxID=1176646 RepID=A0ABX6T0Z7_9SPHN|nr:hypothetical protein [Sphingomonas daechungensis]QNP43239.1 hypothetical protein H9L15_15185 [Sphingomonas daechungensis]